jgi:hypothetical protein
MVVDMQTPRMHLKLADDETEIDLAALQGLWSVAQYLKLADQTNRLIEYTDGMIEVLPLPIDETITVLVLQGNAYTAAGVFHRGERAISTLLHGFSVSVDEVLSVR